MVKINNYFWFDFHFFVMTSVKLI